MNWSKLKQKEEGGEWYLHGDDSVLDIEINFCGKSEYPTLDDLVLADHVLMEIEAFKGFTNLG